MARVLTIDGEVVKIAPNWSITDRINNRTTLSCEVIDLLNLTAIDNGDSIVLTNNGTVIFSGLVKNIVKQEVVPNVLSYSIQAVDNSALADKVRIAKVYENMSAGDIVTDLIAEKLVYEGVTAGTISDGYTIVKAVFNYITVSDALDFIKNLTGYVWNIDKDRKLHFYDRLTNKSPYTLDSDIRHSGFRHTMNMDDYRNTQYVRGGRARTSAQTQERPSPKPDGESRNFVLRFPVAEKPVIEINLNGAGWVAINSADIGVNGLDTGKKWYFTYNSQTITQDSAETVLVDVDAVRITYTGLRNLLVKIDNPEEVYARQTAETGTSGVYEAIAVETNINTSQQAIQYGEGMLDTYGQIKDTISFNTNVIGFEAGQLLTVDKPLYGLTGSFLIDSVSIRPDSPATVQFSINALDGAAIGGWEEFFKKLVRGQQDFVIGENEVIILLNTFTERQGYQGKYYYSIIEPSFYPDDDIYPDDDLLPDIGRNYLAVYPLPTLYPGTFLYPGRYVNENVIID